jgi:hypothetical protein
VILFPLFAVAVIRLDKKFSEIVRDSFLFLGGFLPAVIIPWFFVIIQPGGFEGFKAIVGGFYKVAGVYLSGNSLNIGWIAGYFIFPKISALNTSLASISMVNPAISANSVPYIFRGILFYIVMTIITFRYWIFQKKNVVTFTAAAAMIFFSHQMLGKGNQDMHFIYSVVLMLYLYLIKPTPGNRLMLILLDIMAIFSLIFFYCLTGYPCLFRISAGGIDITVIFAVYYTIIYLWVLWRYLKGGLLFEK